MKKPLTQLEKLLKYMRSHKGITGLQAVRVVGTLYLPRRIKDLQQRGYKIESEYINVKNADGKKIRVKQYRLVE